MSRQSLAAPLMGAAAVLGGGVYYARQPSNTSGDPAQQVSNADHPRPSSDEVVAQKRQHANAKRDLGLGGAGVGNNHATGGTDIGSGLLSGNTEDPSRSTAKGPTEKFPSDAGQVGGGHGRGNSNTRAIETHGPSTSPGSSTLTGALKGENSSSGGGGGSSEGGISEKLHGLFTSGGKASDKPRQAPVDTKIASHHADTPTNKGGSPWDKHRRDVTAVTPTES
ncbi:hypothetical protein EsH8_I_001369 [Colletotrichum jinshuiense]